jgi:hypothetical protein
MSKILHFKEIILQEQTSQVNRIIFNGKVKVVPCKNTHGSVFSTVYKSPFIRFNGLCCNGRLQQSTLTYKYIDTSIMKTPLIGTLCSIRLKQSVHTVETKCS